jgi:hypothetical protein
MGTLKEDIITQSDWIIKAFAADGLTLDYSIKSFIEIDKFFNKHSTPGKAKRGGRLVNRLGSTMFSIASYIIETIKKQVPDAVLFADDEAADGEVTMSITLPDGGVIFPMQRVMKRFENGEEDSIYVYGHQLTKDFTNEPFDDSYWDINKMDKSWWKFW